MTTPMDKAQILGSLSTVQIRLGSILLALRFGSLSTTRMPIRDGALPQTAQIVQCAFHARGASSSS